jgi:hypothetical protein
MASDDDEDDPDVETLFERSKDAMEEGPATPEASNNPIPAKSSAPTNLYDSDDSFTTGNKLQGASTTTHGVLRGNAARMDISDMPVGRSGVFSGPSRWAALYVSEENPAQLNKNTMIESCRAKVRGVTFQDALEALNKSVPYIKRMLFYYLI